ncbi:hypothetical protein WJX84_005441 [Apatococcus fuscideae]|uniref:Uncharacterized protein n=1 Tax=Apatococcus fuscideae TaxID=2026836 RepID=A0AAW1TCD4_9CHLO
MLGRQPSPRSSPKLGLGSGPFHSSRAHARSRTSSLSAPQCCNPVVASDNVKSAWDKAYQYSVDLRLVSLRGSVPSAWIDDFKGSIDGKGRVSMSQRGQLLDVFKELSDLKKKNSAATADAVTLGDAWLGPAVARGLLQPIPEAAAARWWSCLYPHWRQLVQRNGLGHAAADGHIWAAPYRWGATLVAFRKDLLLRAGGKPIRDWSDLLQPRLRGRLGFVDAPREFLGVALRSLGLSMNEDLSEEACSAPLADVQARIHQFRKQVRVFSNNEHGRGPSPLLPAWLEHGLQPQRAQRSKGLDQGASPLLLPGAASVLPHGRACTAAQEPSDESSITHYGMAADNMPAETVLERSEFLLPVNSQTMQLHTRLLQGMR